MKKMDKEMPMMADMDMMNDMHKKLMALEMRMSAMEEHMSQMHGGMMHDMDMKQDMNHAMSMQKVAKKSAMKK